MATDNSMHPRIDMVWLVLLGLVAGLRAAEITLVTPKSWPEATRPLSFPSDHWLGSGLYIEPESGASWNLEGVMPSGPWEYLCAARGDVRVPAGRNVKLGIVLELSPSESQRFRAENPQMHRMLMVDRTHAYASDLSGLSRLDPNDVFWLSVGSVMYRRMGVNPETFAPIRRLTSMQILTLESSGITDQGLAHLRSLRSLKGLELTQFPVGTQGLAVLNDLPHLEYLALNTGLTDAGLKQVAQLSRLRWLRIVDGQMWGPGLAELVHLPRLERLCIHHSRGQLSDRHIKCLEGLTQLKSLTLWSSGCDTLTDASLASIGKLTALEELYFMGTMPRFTPAGVACLKGLRHLKKVHFGQAWAGPAGVQYGDEVVRQLAALPHLESIRGVSYLSAAGMKTLASFRNLKCLEVDLKDREQGYQGPSGLAHLAGLTALEDLTIASGDGLPAIDLARLEPLSHLRVLSLAGGGITDEGLASIGRLKSLERLRLHTATRSGLNHLNRLSNLQSLQVIAWGKGAKAIETDERMLDLSGLEKVQDLNLSGLPLDEQDLAFLEHLRLLKHLMIHPASPVTATSLRCLRELPELTRLHVGELSGCTGEDLAHLNGLPKLRSLTVTGDITDAALVSLTGPGCLQSLRVDTDAPIRRETVTALTESHPEIEYIHIQDLTAVPPRSLRTPGRMRATHPK